MISEYEEEIFSMPLWHGLAFKEIELEKLTQGNPAQDKVDL